VCGHDGEAISLGALDSRPPRRHLLLSIKAVVYFQTMMAFLDPDADHQVRASMVIWFSVNPRAAMTQEVAM